VPWSALCALIEPFYPKPGNGRPPVGVERMRLGVALKPHRRQRQLLHPPTQCSNPPRQILYHDHCSWLMQRFPNAIQAG
jgi:hypothetical protein